LWTICASSLLASQGFCSVNLVNSNVLNKIFLFTIVYIVLIFQKSFQTLTYIFNVITNSTYMKKYVLVYKPEVLNILTKYSIPCHVSIACILHTCDIPKEHTHYTRIGKLFPANRRKHAYKHCIKFRGRFQYSNSSF
jgi:hypothetical protein